jgi:Holliday junction resolvase RusA-like endonuclease
MRITVPMIPPSPNELRRKYRNPLAYKRLRESWEHSLAYAVPSASDRVALVSTGRNRKVRVKITLFHSGKYDPDNLIGACKPVLDALKNIHYIRDDSDQWLDFALPEQFYSSRGSVQTTIDIEEVS